ncbi:RNA polymerase sigma factor [Faecalicatena contorta]|uniref:RNA polymerase sigma factor n=1 Tax=Faecalicatena contorta TaxID=39482 RepID=UPI001F441DD5|nr:RNA polymerase sigma factor [Faecalicatena contorta]MCF2553922.1 RNA polymerase sigma factor [Faecalicatena contorta]
MKCDENTFVQMYETVYKDLYRFALCMMKNAEDAEDAVADAVLAAYENIRKLRNKEAFRSWMFTIVANTCRKRLRQAAKRNENEQEETLFQIPARSVDHGLAVDVRKAFFILSEEEQMIVGLSVFGGYNSTEIGKILKLNANTVRSRRKRALAKMECILK